MTAIVKHASVRSGNTKGMRRDYKKEKMKVLSNSGKQLRQKRHINITHK